MVDRAASRKKQTAATLGTLAEELVAQWLIEQGWQILQRRWHCRWGELDLVAQDMNRSSCLAFVEVKARRQSQKRWDEGGLLAITAQKRRKLGQAAALFLADYPDLVVLPCRFDVALVQYHPARISGVSAPVSLVQIGQPVWMGGYQLTLCDYIEAAFEPPG